jgi:adenylate cyclase
MPLIVPVDPVSALQLNAADALFVRDTGPHLGYRSHRNDIVLVTITGPHDANADVDLYSALLKDGAKVVADPRPVNGPDDAATIVQNLEQSSNAAGHVFRNIQVPANSAILNDEEKLNFVGGDVPYSDAATDVNHLVRYYPMLWVDGDARTDETMVIKVARVALGSPLATNPVQVARDSGVLGVWVRLGLAPSQLSVQIREAEKVRPRPYPLAADHAVRWIVHPSDAFPALISPAAIWINYRSQPGSYRTVTASDVMSGKVTRALQGKVVIIDGTGPLFSAPTSARAVTWAEADAQVLEEVLDGSYLVPEGLEALIAVFVLALGGSIMFALLPPLRALGVVGLFLIAYVVVSVFVYRSGTFPDVVLAPTALFASSVASGSTRYAQGVIERGRNYKLFGRQVPPAVAALAERGSRREVTVLVAELRGLAEHDSPDATLKQLNAALRKLMESAGDEQGTLEISAGEVLMVLFNAPLNQPDHDERAVRAAIKMQTALTSGPLSVGIGIHSGEAVVGNVGTPERLGYTAVGATVDLASRLCDSAARGEVVISEEVRLALGDRIEAQARAPITVKGVGGGVATYRVTGLRESV